MLYLRDAAGFHEYAASMQRVFTNGNFTIAGKTGDQYIEADSRVCDGLRGDAFVAAHEVGFDNLCEIVDGRPRGVDTLILHIGGMFFFRPNTNLKNCSSGTCRLLGGSLSRQNGESMKQYVSRRRRSWTHLVQIDPVIHLSEGHRSDMLLDLSGLTREGRVMVQDSISNETLLTPSSSNVHVFMS